jgi:Carbohydrate esterase, sialic acid-specific acetylesterase
VKRGGRTVAVVTAAVVVAVASSAAGASSSPRDLPSAPANVTVAASVGHLTVSWHAPANATSGAVTYKVHSVPAGRTCTTTSLSCTFDVRDATPWRFAVGATDASGTGPNSALTAGFRHLTVLLVAGQSNALGYESYAVDPTTHRNVLASGAVAIAAQHSLATWVESGVPNPGLPPVALSTPQVRVGASSPIFGPEMGLVSKVYGTKHPHVLVVKAAFVGTSLAKDWASSGPLYKGLVAQTNAALAWAADNGWSATIAGIYWVQGETDAEYPAMAAAYAKNLRHLISSLRLDLRVSSATPVVLARIDVAKYVDYRRQHGQCTPAQCSSALRGNQQVRDAQWSVARADAHVFIVDTSKLARVATIDIHLSNAAQLTLGRAFASASLKSLT